MSDITTEWNKAVHRVEQETGHPVHRGRFWNYRLAYAGPSSTLAVIQTLFLDIPRNVCFYDLYSRDLQIVDHRVFKGIPVYA